MSYNVTNQTRAALATPPHWVTVSTTTGVVANPDGVVVAAMFSFSPNPWLGVDDYVFMFNAVGYVSDEALTGTIELYDLTNGAVVSTASVTSTSPQTFRQRLSVGEDSGMLRTDSAATYEIRVSVDGSLVSDTMTYGNCALVVINRSALGILLEEGFEDGVVPAGWQVVALTGDTQEWGVGDPSGTVAGAAHTGSYCAGTVVASDGYGNEVHYALVTPKIDYLDKSSRTFSWWAYLATETGFDGGNLQWTDDGSTWNVVDSAYLNVSYNTTVGGANPMSGQDAWTHETDFASWQQYVVDVDALIAAHPGTDEDKIQFRFQFGSDAATATGGWWVDDVQATGQ